MVLDFFLGISQNHDADSIPLLQSVALYLWCALTVYVASQTGTLPRESPGLQNSVGGGSLIAKQRRLSPDLKGLKEIAACKKYAILPVFLHSSIYWRQHQKWRPTIDNARRFWVDLYVSMLDCQILSFFFFGRPLRNSEWKFDSNVCWLHYKQRTVIFA